MTLVLDTGKIWHVHNWLVCFCWHGSSPSILLSVLLIDSVLARHQSALKSSAVPLLMCREPAKFVAKLRENKTDNRILLFKCDLGAGHFSQSGRFDRLKDTALEYAFLLKCQDLVDT
jgi:hypothetical protein